MSIGILEPSTDYDPQAKEDIRKRNSPVGELIKDLKKQWGMEDEGKQTGPIIKGADTQSKPVNFEVLEPQQTASKQKTLYKKDELTDSKKVEFEQIDSDQTEVATSKAQELISVLPQIEKDFLTAIYEHVEQKEQGWVLERGKELKKLWHKGWLARLGVGGALTVMGIVNPGFLLAKLGWRIATASVGSTLGAEAIWSKMEAARFTRKEGKTWESYKVAGKTFLGILWQKKSLKIKEGFGLGQAIKESREKLVQVGHISSKEELNKELEILGDSEKLAEIKKRIAGIAEIARRQGIRLEEVAGAQKSIEVLLDTYQELRESVQAESANELIKKHQKEIEDPDVTLEQFKAKVIAELVAKEQAEWQELLSSAIKDENQRAIKRWVGSAAIGIVSGLLTLGLAKGLGLGEHKEAVGAAVATGAITKEVAKEKVATFVQDAAQPGELRATIPNSFYGPNIHVVEHDGHQWAQIDNKEYPYLVENGQKLIIVHADINHDGLPDANSTVKINLDNGFGEFSDQAGQKHIMQALDLYKEGINRNADAIIARDGAILHDAGGKMINGQIWQEKDGFHASVIGKVEVSPADGQLNPAGIVYDETPDKLPPEFRDNPIAKEVFGRSYEIEYLSAQNIHQLAEQYLHLYDPDHADPEHIAKLEAKLAELDPNHADISKIDQIHKIFLLEQSDGLTYSQACKDFFIKEDLVSKEWGQVTKENKLLIIKKILSSTNKEIPLLEEFKTSDKLTLLFNDKEAYLINTQADNFDLGKSGVIKFSFQALENLIKKK